MAATKLYFFPYLHQTTTVFENVLNFIKLYFFPYLHQTTTPETSSCLGLGCISFLIYIKPQLRPALHRVVEGCISFLIYIKPQLWHHEA